MDRLEQAQARLEKALSRLEQAAGKPKSDSSPQDEIDALRRRCASLEDRSHQVSERLDAAIGRLRSILEA